MLNISHLGGELSLSVKGVQVTDHDISRLLEPHRLGWLVNWVQDLLLHSGVKGYSSSAGTTAAVCGPAALRRRRRLSVDFHITCQLETQMQHQVLSKK